MQHGSNFVIVGGGLAGCSVASMLVNAGRASEVTIFEGELAAPYDRPPLTKSFLAEQDTLSAWPAWAPREVSWRHEQVATVDAARRHLVTAGGEEILAAVIVLAIGSRARTLPGRSQRVITIRTADDARRLRAVSLEGGSRFLIEGAGPLGLEIASTLAGAGAEVTVVDLAAKPMMRLAGGALGDEVLGWAREAGIDMTMGAQVSDVIDGDGPWGVRVRIAGGESEAFDGMVSAVGVQPAALVVTGTADALPSPLVTDRHGRLLDTSGIPLEGVYAVGDATGTPTPSGHIARSEAWTAARVQGEGVGRHILGVPDQARPVPYFWTRQFGKMVQVLGDVPEGSNLEVVAEIPQVAGSLYQARCEGVPVGYVGVNAQRFIGQLQVQSGGPAQWTLTGV